MNPNFSRAASSRSIIEILETRTLLSGTTPVADSHSAAELSAIVVAAKAVKRAATTTTLSASAGTLSQPVTFTATVRAAAAAGSPAGTVNIIDHGKVIDTITLAPTTSSNPKYAYSEGSVTLTQQPGGSAYFFGKHLVSATFVPSGPFLRSSGRDVFTVSQPTYTLLPDGVGIDTIVTGSGAPVEAGDTANVLYTAYLARSGRIFDDSIKDGGTPYPAVVDGGMVIQGFNDGITGMEVGETQIVEIPPAEGYGSSGSPPAIPRNATLIFVMTLVSYS